MSSKQPPRYPVRDFVASTEECEEKLAEFSKKGLNVAALAQVEPTDVMGTYRWVVILENPYG